MVPHGVQVQCTDCVAVQFTSRQRDVKVYSVAMVACLWKPNSRGQRSVALLVLDKLQLIALVSPRKAEWSKHSSHEKTNWSPMTL